MCQWSGRPTCPGQLQPSTGAKQAKTKSVFFAKIRNLEKGALERGTYIQLSEIDFQIRDKFAIILRTLPLMYDTKYRQFCAGWCASCDILRNPPFASAPFSGVLKQVSRQILRSPGHCSDEVDELSTHAYLDPQQK